MGGVGDGLNQVPGVFPRLFLPFRKSLDIPVTEGRWLTAMCCRGWLKCFDFFTYCFHDAWIAVQLEWVEM